MARLILTRLALFVPTLFAASVILFIAINVVPGSAARSALGVDATPQAIMRFEASNGLNRPLAVQYTEWLGKALRGDLGTSSKIAFRSRLRFLNGYRQRSNSRSLPSCSPMQSPCRLAP